MNSSEGKAGVRTRTTVKAQLGARKWRETYAS